MMIGLENPPVLVTPGSSRRDHFPVPLSPAMFDPGIQSYSERIESLSGRLRIAPLKGLDGSFERFKHDSDVDVA
jgi:hypothetical protein